ncbi:MAG: hypothetical protein H0W44_06735 [Gammaproteobacteria bacterium]|nr:hypothetical protein [Gammaproteobacteria bacterium]
MFTIKSKSAAKSINVIPERLLQASLQTLLVSAFVYGGALLVFPKPNTRGLLFVITYIAEYLFVLAGAFMAFVFMNNYANNYALIISLMMGAGSIVIWIYLIYCKNLLSKYLFVIPAMLWCLAGVYASYYGLAGYNAGIGR